MVGNVSVLGTFSAASPHQKYLRGRHSPGLPTTAPLLASLHAPLDNAGSVTVERLEMHIEGVTSQRFLHHIPKVEEEARLTQRDRATLNVS